jgi:glycosyltransferase involved in cell wall biosynthesis
MDNEIPRYAIIIATRNRGHKIEATLQSILKSQDPSYEVLIIDQSSNCETEEAVAPFLQDGRVRYIYSEITGTCYARNLGIRLSSAPYLVITDDDCLLPEDWLQKITAPFDQHSEIGVVFCTVEPLPYNSVDGFTPNIIFEKNRIIHSPSESFHGLGKGLGLGAGMAIRRSLIESIQGFDQSLGPGAQFPSAEDKDVAIRALYKGWWVYENADIAVLHDGFRTWEEMRNLSRRDFYGMGATFSKYIKVGDLRILRLVLTWMFIFGIYMPFQPVAHLHRPKGFKRFYYLMHGVVDGLRKPVEKGSVRYVSDTPYP